MKVKKGFLLLILIIMYTLGINAETKLTAKEILDQIAGTSALNGSGSALIKLKTINRKGQEKQQSLLIYRLETSSEEKQLIEFTAPNDVKGTKFLSLKNTSNNQEEMWLYLPALKRERRIAGHMTQDNFMGTDFTFEEISGSYKDNYLPTRLADEKIGQRNCYVLELQPKDKTSQYKMVKMWIWQEELLPLKIEFYNKDGKLWKELLAENIEKQSNGIYLPLKISMLNKLAETTTIIIVEGNSAKEPKADYFTMQYLRR